MLFIQFYLWVLPGMGFVAQPFSLSYPWIHCLEGKLPKDPSGVDGNRYSVMRISMGGLFHVGWSDYVADLGYFKGGHS